MSIDYSQVFQRLDEIVDFFGDEEENEIAQILRTRIINRTLNGIDINGASFIPYSIPYAKKRYRNGLPVSPVDLWAKESPHLLESITRMDDHTLFVPAEFVPMGQGNQNLRLWWGASDDDWYACREAVVLKYNSRF
jgi:hypothetical protein